MVKNEEELTDEQIKDKFKLDDYQIKLIRASKRAQERIELGEGLRFLEEVVLIALYGNWFITFIDNLTFPFYNEMPQIQRFQLITEGMGVMFLITTLGLYFIDRRQRSNILWGLHLALIIIIVFLEATLDPVTITLKTLTFNFIGIIFWVLIQGVDDFRERFGLVK
ncbi:MAG: hypothetical protein NWE88_02075 [Candidatus Bathyarchaeota archaeon]|nr:hypothetical protein [Candidatus Bathyarchaeota archaeon]